MSYKVLILVVAMLASGALRMGFEDRLSADLKQQKLLPDQLQVETRDKIEQTAWAVTIGGLRTVVASFRHLRSVSLFAGQKWHDLAQLYEMLVDLAPRTRYYWDSGFWHMTYNAASFYMHDSELPPLRCREAWRGYIHQGRAFLERGIRNNPDDWSLHARLGALLIDPNKFVAFHDREETFTQATEAFGRAEASGRAPARVSRFRLYALSRVAGREGEALEVARRLYASHPRHRTPTLRVLLYVLECHADPQCDVEPLAIRLFGSAEKAHEMLTRHWQSSRECYPMDGVARGLAVLEARLGIPESQSTLRQAPVPPSTPDDWFRTH